MNIIKFTNKLKINNNVIKSNNISFILGQYNLL